MNKQKIKEKLVNLQNNIIKRRWQILTILFLTVFLIDYFDFGLLVGWGVISRQVKTNLLEVLVALLLAITLYETRMAGKAAFKQIKIAFRQTEITLRPYMRLAWDAAQIGPNRTAQGITDTCIVVVNNGNGLMRQIKYKVKVNGKEVKVRNHALISSGSPTNMVYGDTKSRELGCRNDSSFNTKNNKIIKEKIIEVSGYYRDVEGGRYNFSFVSDVNQQSWFKEKYLQTLRNRDFKID